MTVTTRSLSPLISLVTADGLSRAGNAMTGVAIPLIVLDQTGSALATGGAGIATTLPIVLGGALGGAFTDWIGFKRASIIADFASGLTLLLLAFLVQADTASLPIIFVLVFFSNLLDTPGMSARASQLPELSTLAGLPLPRAAGLKATISRLSTMLGAAGAAVIISIASPSGALYINAIGFALSIMITIFGIPSISIPSPSTNEQRDSTSSNKADIDLIAQQEKADGSLRALFAGMTFIARTPLILAITSLVVLTNLFDTAGLSVLNPQYAKTITTDGSLLGLLTATFAGGALMGAAFFGIVGHRWASRKLFVFLFLLAGPPTYFVMATGLPFWIVLVTFGLSGLSAGAINPMIDTALFGLIPVQIRARTLGALSSAVAAGMPLGSLYAGVLSQRFGLTTALLVTGSLYLAVILLSSFGSRWDDFNRAVRSGGG